MSKIELEDSLIKAIECRRFAINQALLDWEAQHYRNFPWRGKRTPYSVLISEVLLKRTTASAATHVFEKFLSIYPNMEVLSLADKKQLEELLSRIGYHKRRAKILVEIAKHLLTEYGGQVPSSREELLAIPNIGNYTANAVQSFGYGIPTAIVDCNVERIIKRVFLKHLETRKSNSAVQKVASMLSPLENNQLHNYALLDLGAIVCKYGLPRCKSCPINNWCDYYTTGKNISKTNTTNARANQNASRISQPSLNSQHFLRKPDNTTKRLARAKDFMLRNLTQQNLIY
jgi:A/G-specific adenine glycosylase